MRQTVCWILVHTTIALAGPGAVVVAPGTSLRHEAKVTAPGASLRHGENVVALGAIFSRGATIFALRDCLDHDCFSSTVNDVEYKDVRGREQDVRDASERLLESKP